MSLDMGGSQSRTHSTRSDVYSDGTTDRRIISSYSASGGGRVVIHEPIDPWQVLGIPSSTSSFSDIKAAFRMKTAQQDRQNRAMVSIAYHMLMSLPGTCRYTRKNGTDEYIVTRPDHFMLAACGHTEKLALHIDRRRSLVEHRDEYGRTLLYLASISGFYDTCELLLQKGASVNEVQCDGSTPLHGAAFFGQQLVVGLLLQYGAKSDLMNKWGNTALDESATVNIKSLIQTASTDRISSLVAELRQKEIVLNVCLVKYKGEVIAKELIRDPRTLDACTRENWNDIYSTWETAWHGTRYECLRSIVENGLLPAGKSGIQPLKGHVGLGSTYLGISNWAAAIFVSPSILYAAHAAYSERIFSESQRWCVLIKVYCKPGSYTSHDPTVVKYDPMDGEPEATEYRVPVNEEDKSVVQRVESARNVVVRSLMFVRLSFLENPDVDFDKAMELLR